MYEAKLNAETHIDELIQISERGDKNVPNRKPKHKKMARNGWNYRTAHFEDFDGRYYKLTISVADGDYGKIAYNIGKVERESKPNHQKWSIDENIDHPSGSKADDLAAFSNASIPKTNANGNTSGENVTQLQQTKRQMAYTDESDELFERPVNNTPILSAEELAERNEEYIRQDNARREEAIANNRRLREQGVFAMADTSEDAAEDLSDRDAVLDEFWTETYQDGRRISSPAGRSMSSIGRTFGSNSRRGRMSLKQSPATRRAWRIYRRFLPARGRSPKRR